MNKNRSIVCTPTSDPHAGKGFTDFSGLPGRFTVALIDTDYKVFVAGVTVEEMRCAEARIDAYWVGLDAQMRRRLIDGCVEAMSHVVLGVSSIPEHEVARGIMVAVLVLVRYQKEELYGSVTETILEAGGAHLNATWAPSAGVVFQLCVPEGRRVH